MSQISYKTCLQCHLTSKVPKSSSQPWFLALWHAFKPSTCQKPDQTSNSPKTILDRSYAPFMKCLLAYFQTKTSRNVQHTMPAPFPMFLTAYDQTLITPHRPTLDLAKHLQLTYQTCLKPYPIPKPNWPEFSTWPIIFHYVHTWPIISKTQTTHNLTPKPTSTHLL